MCTYIFLSHKSPFYFSSCFVNVIIFFNWISSIFCKPLFSLFQQHICFCCLGLDPVDFSEFLCLISVGFDSFSGVWSRNCSFLLFLFMVWITIYPLIVCSLFELSCSKTRAHFMLCYSYIIYYLRVKKIFVYIYLQSLISHVLNHPVDMYFYMHTHSAVWVTSL